LSLRAWRKTPAGREYTRQSKAKYAERKRLRAKLQRIHDVNYVCPLLEHTTSVLESAARRAARAAQLEAWAAIREAKSREKAEAKAAQEAARAAKAAAAAQRRQERAAERETKLEAQRQAKAARELEAAGRRCPLVVHAAHESSKARARAYAREHKDETYARIKADPTKRLDLLFSNALRSSLRKRKSHKGGRSWESLVGYDVHQLRAHIEALFEPGMSWANHGEWHIDHAIPKTWWEYSSPDDPEFRQCWALANLKPMWGPDNISKGNRSCG